MSHSLLTRIFCAKCLLKKVRNVLNPLLVVLTIKRIPLLYNTPITHFFWKRVQKSLQEE